MNCCLGTETITPAEVVAEVMVAVVAVEDAWEVAVTATIGEAVTVTGGAAEVLEAAMDVVSHWTLASMGKGRGVDVEVPMLATVLMAGPLSPLGMGAKGSCCWMVPLVLVHVPDFKRSCKLCFTIMVLAFVGDIISVSLSFFFFLLDLVLFLLESMMVWPLWRVATYSF